VVGTGTTAVVHAALELRRGRAVVLEDTGAAHVVAAAPLVTAALVTFMAREARGVICVALPEARCHRLGLRPVGYGPHRGTGARFMTSIEARHGIATGISARDRARTIAVAADPAADAADVVSPGHVFPLAAAPGGVLEYAGQVEAAVDLVALAGLAPAAVLCGVLAADGDVARGSTLADFRLRHGLASVDVPAVVAHRRRLHARGLRRTA
jgi:3,4-dihydroxy 2-butanone 4-phosphate synthase/GTP cyclohydrolase II